MDCHGRFRVLAMTEKETRSIRALTMTVFPKQKANPIQAVGFSLNN